MGATNIAPGEDGYVFKFSRDNAAAFTVHPSRKTRPSNWLDFSLSTEAGTTRN